MCGEYKAFKHFGVQSSNASGLHSYCRVCANTRNRAQWRLARDTKACDHDIVKKTFKVCSKCSKVFGEITTRRS